MRNLTIFLTLLIPLLVWGAPKEQDRAILEGNQRNILSNPGFEGRKSNWTNTGSSTFTLETAAPAAGNVTAKWDPSATGEFFRSELIVVPEGLKGRSCSLIFDYKWASGVAAEIKANVDDGSTDLATVDLDPADDYRASTPLLFTCPSSGSIRVELESTADAAEISLDAFEFGKLDTVIGLPDRRAVIDVTGSGDFTAGTLIVTRAGRIVTITDDSGDQVTFSSASTPTSASGLIPTWARPNTQKINDYSFSASQVFRITVDSSGTVEFSFVDWAGSASVRTDASFGWTLTYSIDDGLGVQESVTLETVGKYWDVNIGGANPDLGTGNVASYTEIIDAGLDMVINPNSDPAEIPCSTTNPSTGLTCAAGSESVGIVIQVTETARYKACAQISNTSTAAVSTSTINAFQWVETPNNAQTISQLGREIAHNSNTPSTSGIQGISFPNRMCSSFTLSTGQKTLRIMYEQAVTGSITSSVVVADRSASAGQRDVHITVEKMDQHSLPPFFPEVRNKADSGITNVNLRAFEILCSSSSAVTTDQASAISSIGNISSGVCTIELNTVFSNKPQCVISSASTSDPDILGINPSDSDTIPIGCNDDAGADCTTFEADIFCWGQ